MSKVPPFCHWVLCACAWFGVTGAVNAAPGDAEPAIYTVNDLKEGPIYRVLRSGIFDSLYISSNTGGMTVKEANIQITVDSGTRQQVLVAVEGKDGQIAKKLAGMAPGDLAVITTETKFNHIYVKTFDPYKAHDGEDRPGVYLFVANTAAQVGGEDTQIVKLYKLGHFTEARVPNVSDKATKQKSPDPKIMEVVNQLHPGEMVQVEAFGGGDSPLLQKIGLFPRVQTGVIESVGEAEVDGGKTAELRVTIGPNTKTILVPGRLVAKDRWVPDLKLAQMVKGFKANDRVVIRARPEGDKLWLCEIAKAPPDPAASK